MKYELLRARLRPRDYDITKQLEQLDLTPGELSEMVRDGMRLILARRKAKEPDFYQAPDRTNSS